MSKPVGNLRKKRCPNQEEIFGKRDVQPAGDLRIKRSPNK